MLTADSAVQHCCELH